MAWQKPPAWQYPLIWDSYLWHSYTSGGRWKYKPEKNVSLELGLLDLEDLMMLLSLILE